MKSKEEKVRDTLDEEYRDNESQFTEKRSREILGDEEFEKMIQKLLKAKRESEAT